jgi:hypothetical protein
MLSNLSPDKRLQPPVQLGDPSVRVQARHAVAGHGLSILPDADTRSATPHEEAEPLALPIALHHRRVRRQRGHARGLVSA